MLHSFIWYIRFFATLIGYTPKLWKAKHILKTEGQAAHDAYAYRVTTAWAKARLKDSKANFSVMHAERIPKDRNVLFVSNHQSDFDIAVFMGLIEKPTGFVAKIEMQQVPCLSHWMRNIHCVFMDRKNLKQSMKVILEGISNLKAGYTMTIFPEGTRSKSNLMGEFKAGSFKLATKSGVPIVPVTMNGTYKIMEGNNYRIRPADVEIVIHEPIYLEGMSKEEQSALPERVQNIIASALENNTD